MWKYCTKEQCEEFLLSLDLVNKNWTNKKKLKCLYALSNNTEKHYKSFELKKQNGKTRKILAPDYLLKNVQYNILHNILENVSISNYATAYFNGADIINNAIPHLKHKIVLKMDIKNFFENIDFMMIYKYVFPTIYYPPAVKNILINICCYNDYLPQGAPTSPAISNIIMKHFDKYIGKWCEENNITYTRYCDDLTFSGSFDVNLVKNKVRSFLEAMGFQINNKKTQILSNNKRQIVTGIVVNEKIQTSRNYRKKIRQEIYYCNKFGTKSHLEKNNMKVDIVNYLQSLLGKINFVLHINPKDSECINAKNFVIKEIRKYSNI